VTAKPSAEVIPRRGRGTEPAEDQERPVIADWEMVQGKLRDGPFPAWLATIGRGGAPHLRPVFAAWGGASFYVVSKRDAVKSRNMRADGRCSVSADIGSMHVVVEGEARRVTDQEQLEEASRAMSDVYDWSTEVVGEELDADYGAPTSGGPPYEVYEVQPSKALGFPAGDGLEPTRWRFEEPEA
jgi:hypothetical protein